MVRLQIASALERLGISSRILALRRGTVTPWLTVVSYHRVISEPVPASLDFDVITPRETFDRHLGMLTAAFDIVGLDEVFAFLRGASLPRSPLMITFDDGYLDNHDVVLPLLQRHGARATFFVATSYVASRRIFWWDMVNHLVKTANREFIELRYPRLEIVKLGTSADDRARAVHRMLDLIKTTYALHLPRFLEDLSKATGSDLSRTDERRLADAHIMTWDHVRTLRRAGMDVQSHTRTHRVLHTLLPSDLVHELQGSRADLEAVLNEPVRALSYPVGRRPLDTTWIRDAVRDAGYHAGFSNRGGVNSRLGCDALDLKRISLENNSDNAHVRAILALPVFAY